LAAKEKMIIRKGTMVLDMRSPFSGKLIGNAERSAALRRRVAPAAVDPLIKVADGVYYGLKPLRHVYTIYSTSLPWQQGNVEWHDLLEHVYREESSFLRRRTLTPLQLLSAPYDVLISDMEWASEVEGVEFHPMPELHVTEFKGLPHKYAPLDPVLAFHKSLPLHILPAAVWPFISKVSGDLPYVKKGASVLIATLSAQCVAAWIATQYPISLPVVMHATALQRS